MSVATSKFCLHITKNVLVFFLSIWISLESLSLSLWFSVILKALFNVGFFFNRLFWIISLHILSKVFLDMSRIDEQSEEIIITRTYQLEVLDVLVMEYCPTVTNKQDFSSLVNGTVQTFDSCYFHGSAHWGGFLLPLIWFDEDPQFYLYCSWEVEKDSSWLYK